MPVLCTVCILHALIGSFVKHNIQKLSHFEMEVRMAGDDGSKSRTFIAKYDGEDADSDEPLVGSLTPKQRKQREDKEFRHQLSRQLAFMCTAVAGEFIGTFLLTLVICSVVAVSIVTSAHMGLWQVAVVCGLGVAISIYTTAHLSDAHLNPAITLAFAVVRWRTFSWKRILPYVIF